VHRRSGGCYCSTVRSQGFAGRFLIASLCIIQDSMMSERERQIYCKELDATAIRAPQAHKRPAAAVDQHSGQAHEVRQGRSAAASAALTGGAKSQMMIRLRIEQLIPAQGSQHLAFRNGPNLCLPHPISYLGSSELQIVFFHTPLRILLTSSAPSPSGKKTNSVLQVPEHLNQHRSR
jgi:hypothetical protein